MLAVPVVWLASVMVIVPTLCNCCAAVRVQVRQYPLVISLSVRVIELPFSGAEPMSQNGVLFAPGRYGTIVRTHQLPCWPAIFQYITPSSAAPARSRLRQAGD